MLVSIWGSGEVHKLRGRPTFRGLTIFFPAILRALREHNKNDGGSIKLIVLPNHNISAYQKVMGWYYASITTGKVVRFHRIYHDALTTYREVQFIATDLDAGYLVKAMTARTHAMAAW